MSGWKESIDNRVWMDVYQDGSLWLVDDGNNYETDRVRIGLNKEQMEKIIKTYIYMVETNKRE